MNFNTSCLGSCNPPQIINFNLAINDISLIEIYNDCDCVYNTNELEYAYSLDNLCWSCYMSYDEALTNTIDINSDFYLRIKIKGIIGKILYNKETFTDYSTQLASGFEFKTCQEQNNSNVFNPYANMDCAISLYQQLSETVSCIVGIPCYYIKLSPNQGSKDLTFKEYALMNVESIKQIKIIIQDNEMPSSKPEFNDWGMDWQTDWEVEVTKGSFATAFGPTKQPTEGDLVYIPMMKRMWMVNEAYEEKKDGFMWIASTFKLALVKYQEKDSVDLGDTQSFIDSVVKNKYEDLFGDDDNQIYDAGEEFTDAPEYAANTLYNVFESDAVRKYVTCDSISISNNNIYYRGALISDSKYEFLTTTVKSKIVYQKKYCGDEISISFILNGLMTSQFEDYFLKIGHIKLFIKQEGSNIQIYTNKDHNIKLEIPTNKTTFVIARWSKNMNIIDLHAYKYTFNENIPIYKLSNEHYYFDIDHPIAEYTGRFNDEFILSTKSEVELCNIYGWITNLKIFDKYTDDISDLLQMYPNNQHLMINDTARRLVDLPGVRPA